MDKTVPARHRRGDAQGQKRFTIQDQILFKYLGWSMKESVRFPNWDEFAAHVQEQLPFGALETRRRSWAVISQAFPGRSLDALPARVWRRYHDERLLQDLAHATWLLAQAPEFGRFVTVWLVGLEPGSPVPKDRRDSFLAAEPLVHDPQERLFRVMNDLGFLRRVGPGKYVVAERQLARTAFLLMLLDRFAPDPTTVDVSEVLADPFWRFLGGREAREAREALAAAERAGLLRHERVDQLDQITTRISLAEALDRKILL